MFERHLEGTRKDDEHILVERSLAPGAVALVGGGAIGVVALGLAILKCMLESGALSR